MENREFDIAAFFKYLLKRIYWPIAVGLLCALVGFGITKFAVQPYYKATTSIYILNQSHDDYIAYSDMQSSIQLAADYEVLIRGRNVGKVVSARLNLGAQEVANAKLEVTQVTDTRILQISVTDTDPQRAADIVNCVREVSAEQIVEIMGVDSVNTVYPASAPTTPTGPNIKQNTLYSAVGGVLAACAMLFIIFLLDERIKSEEDVAKYLGLNTIGMIPVTSNLSVKKRRR